MDAKYFFASDRQEEGPHALSRPRLKRIIQDPDPIVIFFQQKITLSWSEMIENAVELSALEASGTFVDVFQHKYNRFRASARLKTVEIVDLGSPDC